MRSITENVRWIMAGIFFLLAYKHIKKTYVFFLMVS